MLEGDVEIGRRAAEPARYSFVLSGSEEMYFKFSAAARFRSLANELATKVSGALGPPSS